MSTYRTNCPFCGQEVSVTEREEHVEVESHRRESAVGASVECGGEVYIDVWEEARAEAELEEKGAHEADQD